MSHSKLAPVLRSGSWRLIVLALLAGCGDSGITSSVDNAPSQLVLTPSDVVMNNHETVQLEVGQRLNNGTVIPLDIPVVWTSSSPAVANVDGTGLLHARLPGEVTVRATSRLGDVSGSVAILPVSADLSLEVADRLLAVAGSAAPLELRARIMDSAGRPVPGVRVDFSIEGASVSVTPASRSTGSDGYASTRVQVGRTAREFGLVVSSPGLEEPAAGDPGPSSSPPGQLRKMVRLEVSPSHPESLEVIPGNAQLVQGEERTFSAVVRDEFGNTIETEDVRWRTLDSGVATVSSTGRVTAVTTGATQVAAEHRQGSRRVEGAGGVLVGTEVPPAPAVLSIVSGSGRSTSVRGEIAGLTIQVLDAAGRPLEGVAAIWSVQSGSGTMVVPATSTDGDGFSSNTFIAGSETGAVSVRAEVEGLDAVAFHLTVGTLSLHISAPRTSLTSLGESLQLEIEARDEVGNVVAAPALTWTSSENNVASVNSSGRVIANAIGTAVISVAAACCSGDQVSISVTQEVASVHVSPLSASMQTGDTRQFTAEARDANGTPIPGVEFRWSSTQQTVASVNSSGLVSVLADGSAVIRAEASGRTGEGEVTVSSDTNAGGGDSFWPNRPSGMVTVTDTDWSEESPWRVFSGMDPETQGSLAIVSDPSAPLGTGSRVLRSLYREGFGDGHEPGRASYVLQTPSTEVYWGAWVKVDANFVNHQFQLKWHFFWMDDNAGSLWVDWRHRSEDNMSNPDNYEESNLRFRFQGPQWNIPQLQEQNVQPQLVTFPRGEWVRLEVHLQKGASGQANGTARLWQDGVLIVDLDNIEYPSNFRYVTHAGTYGGGPQQAPHDQAWYVARTHLSFR